MRREFMLILKAISFLVFFCGHTSVAMLSADPLYSRQSALQNIRIDDAEDLLIDKAVLDTPILVGVIDQGDIHADHPDLQGMIASGSSVTSNRRKVAHGQFVAGIIGARVGNGIGIRGTASRVAKVLYRKMENSDDVAREILHLAKSGVSVINLSLGVARRCNTSNLNRNDRDKCAHPAANSSAINASIMKAMREYNVVVIAAAGNDTDRVSKLPAQDHGFIVVGSSDSSGGRIDFTNFGSGVSVYAPAKQIYGTNYNDYFSQEGTSFSAPLVTGAAALAIAYLKSRQVAYNPKIIKNLILRSARYSKRLEGHAEYPGVLDVYSMARRVRSYVETQK